MNQYANVFYCNLLYHRGEKNVTETKAQHHLCAEKYFRKTNALLSET